MNLFYIRNMCGWVESGDGQISTGLDFCNQNGRTVKNVDKC